MRHTLRGIGGTAAVAAAVLCIGCTEKDATPTGPTTLATTSGTTLLKVLYADSVGAGIRFSTGTVVPFTTGSSSAPDVLLGNMYDPSGKTPISGLRSENRQRTSFHLVGTGADGASARVLFDSLKEAPADHYVTVAYPLKNNQVWTVTTRDQKFAKILITRFETDNLELRITFDWVFQPGGSRSL